MNKNFKYYLKLFSTPLFLLGVFISIHTIWNIFNLPTADMLLGFAQKWFDLYGLPILFVSALIEGMLLVGGYFPGVFVIFVSVILAESATAAALAIAVGTLGLSLAHIINFLLGKYGWYKLLIKLGVKVLIDESKEKLLKKGPIVIFGSYWLPSTGALIDTAAGIIQMPFRIFFKYSLAAGIFWNLLVGIIVYSMGDSALAMVSSGGITELIIQLSIIVIWILILFIIDTRKGNIQRQVS